MNLKRLLLGGQMVAMDAESGALLVVSPVDRPHLAVVTVTNSSATLPSLLAAAGRRLLSGLTEVTIRNQGSADIYLSTEDRPATTDDVPLPAGSALTLPVNADGAATIRMLGAVASVKASIIQIGEE